MTKRNTNEWYRRGNWWRRIRFNRRYKDVLFRYLFRNKEDLLDLYNALSDSTYENPEELEVVTMEDVIFMKMKNDLSFMIGSHLKLYEHQSTWNPNMPLRGMLYFAQQFEGLVAARGDDIYGNRRIELPTPEYIVFYNGSGMHTDNRILCLSAERGVVMHMLLTEYDEKKHLKNTFEEGRKAGIEQGIEKKLREQIQKKLSKGKTLLEISEELEEELSVIERIYFERNHMQ